MQPIKPLVSYEFPCAFEDSKPSIVTQSPSPLGDLKVAATAHGSTNSNSISSITGREAIVVVDSLTCPFAQWADGVESSRLLESTLMVADLQPYFTYADALVVELWITPVFRLELAETSVPIVSVATPTVNVKDDTTYHVSCDGTQFSISQLGNQLEIYYKDFYDYFGDKDNGGLANDLQEFGCRHLIVPDVELQYQVPNHVVVLWKQAGAVFQIYVNGINVVDFDLLGNNDDSLPYTLRSWDPSYKLQLFSNSMTSFNVFPGLIHKMSMFNINLLSDDIATMYQEGLNDRKQVYEFDPNHPLHLIATPIDTKHTTLVQGGIASIGLGGDFNVSTPFWDIMVEFLSLPQYGELVKQDDAKVLEVGERVMVDGGLSRAKMVYQQTRNDFFTIPRYSYNGTKLPHGQESFNYRLIAVNVNYPDQLVGWSEPVHQMIEIVHQNHPPSLEVLGKLVRPLGEQPIDASKRPFARLTNVSLEDELDYDIDRVRVDIWSLNGSLSIISESVRVMADFESCAHRNTSLSSSSVSWQCHGKGEMDSNMTFLATPIEASTILSNIQYDAFHWNQPDVITVRVFDGSGGSCLAEEEHSRGRYQPNVTSLDYHYNTIHSNCYELVREIQVPPLGMPRSSDFNGIHGYLHSVFIDLKDWSWADAFSWGFLLLLIYFIYSMVRCCLGCCGKCIRHRHTAAIHVESMPTSTRTLDCADIEEGWDQ
jgi:hypothetical protein